MALPINYPTAVDTIPGGQLVDVSAASISYAPVTRRGIVVAAQATISAAVTGSDTTVTVKAIRAGAAAVTLGTIVIAVAGSAAGSTFLATMTGTEINRTVNQGDTIVFDSDGVSSTTSIANFTYLLRQ